ncbi:MAG TPA: MBL fold metallo-hydrolase [Spirochaetota bacterium]|nr:MBL fold metallo-hydrolase [Spirochaetota bacterium]
MGLKLKDRRFTFSQPDGLNGIYLCRYAGTFFGLWTINGYFLVVDNFFLDTGNPNSSHKKFIRFINSLDPARKWTILNSHLHEDHCGKNYIVQKKLHAEVYAQDKVEDFSFVSRLMDHVWGRPHMFHHNLFDRDVYETDSGRSIEVILTPGHSDDHAAFRIMPDNIIYSGDAIPLPVKKRYITTGENYLAEIESLKKLLTFAEKGSRFVSAHHGVVSDPVKLISARIEGMTSVVGKVKELSAFGITNVDEISNKVFGKPDIIYRRLGNSIRCRQDWTVQSILDGLK